MTTTALDRLIEIEQSGKMPTALKVSETRTIDIDIGRSYITAWINGHDEVIEARLYDKDSGGWATIPYESPLWRWTERQLINL